MNSDSAAGASSSDVIDLKRSRVVQELKHGRAVTCCRFDPTGTFLFSGGEDSEIQQWEIESGKQTALTGHESWVRGFAFPTRNDSFASAGYDGRLVWWTRESPTPRESKRVQAHRGWIRTLALSADGQLLASGGNDRVVKIWSAGDQTQIAELTGHQHYIYSLAFHPDNEFLVSADESGSVKVWRLSDRTLAREFDASRMTAANKSNRGSAGGLRSLAFTADGRFLLGCGVAGGEDPLGQAVSPGAISFDWQSDESTILRPTGSEKGVCWGMSCHPAAPFVTAVSGGISAKHLYYWKLGEVTPFHVMELPSAGRDTCWHPDGSRLAVALYDGRIQIFNHVS